ncbi:ribosomal protein S18 acetylase RimI-like enzyme [Thermosporothrix hazakensis]|jgi:ribosomal protein S18 acetylase RimI-like enzyme|uniref:Ribosomal protein S18 acetylase RimI-like enzyme n=2 Tax=Thermosporothrix TaxID=768650 RepID=A0A326UWV8_THEHA|nr:GNAT family N-acetyltransferase [Thermosporothrix hazakensis]PZW36793.1 ribosomal protein S18 acetylase RimI-like enzyme [Thermosporothrix hazakensis]BBH89259.1 acetyltransferase [Thermosporothrix sp. COM3]GCE47442.1 acetyltransferase [Thermosporothrix hazakensis]
MDSMIERIDGPIEKRSLTAEDVVAILKLADACNRYENLHMRLLEKDLRDPELKTHFLLYEDGRLAGYLYAEGVEERELSVMVHPAYRRRGIARALVAQAQAVLRAAGATQLQLICEEGAAGGKAFLTALGASLARAEHEMELATFQERFAFDDRLSFQPAQDDEMEKVISVLADISQKSSAHIRQRVESCWSNPHCSYYLLTFGEGAVSCREAVGVVRLDWDRNEWTCWLYSLIIKPEYRGRGYGRVLLEEAIRSLPHDEQWKVKLEVNTTNIPALQLYQSCGFRITRTYGYYLLPLALSDAR